MFLKVTVIKIGIFFLEMKEDFFDLFGSQYLFKVYHTSFNMKNSENVVKRGCFGKLLLWSV